MWLISYRAKGRILFPRVGAVKPRRFFSGGWAVCRIVVNNSSFLHSFVLYNVVPPTLWPPASNFRLKWAGSWSIRIRQANGIVKITLSSWLSNGSLFCRHSKQSYKHLFSFHIFRDENSINVPPDSVIVLTLIRINNANEYFSSTPREKMIMKLHQIKDLEGSKVKLERRF